VEIIKEKKLFAPGPVLTSERIKKAALAPDLCHRSIDFQEIYGRLRKNLLKLFRADVNNYTIVVISGSGTAANEAVISSVVKSDEKVLLISNGEFGNRLREIIECYQIALNHIEFDWGQYPDLNIIEEKLQRDKKIGMVAMVYHETSTGMINPVHEVGELAKRYGKTYFVDAISALGGELVDVQSDNIDFCTGVPNKNISGQPGVSFICVKRSQINKIEDVPRRNIYLRLQSFIEKAEKYNQTPNTPAVVTFLTLNEALEELFEEGLENRIERYRKDARIIREGVKKLGLKMLISDEKVMSNTVTSIFLPPELNLRKFISKMYEDGYVVYPGKGPLLKRNMFQVANMGMIFPEDCYEFNGVMEKVFNELLEENNGGI